MKRLIVSFVASVLLAVTVPSALAVGTGCAALNGLTGVQADGSGLGLGYMDLHAGEEITLTVDGPVGETLNLRIDFRDRLAVSVPGSVTYSVPEDLNGDVSFVNFWSEVGGAVSFSVACQGQPQLAAPVSLTADLPEA